METTGTTGILPEIMEITETPVVLTIRGIPVLGVVMAAGTPVAGARTAAVMGTEAGTGRAEGTASHNRQ
jgi:hypothetical protein